MSGPDKAVMSDIIAKAYADISDRAKKPDEKFRNNVIEESKALDTETRNRVLSVMLEQQNAQIRFRMRKLIDC